MGFGEAISTCFRKYATFSGRARRSEFWYFYLLSLIVAAVPNAIGSSLSSSAAMNGETSAAGTALSLVGGLASLALLIPSIAAAVRRMHDTGRSGWWYLVTLIPCVGAIWFIVLAAGDSGPDNEFGPSPKYPGAGLQEPTGYAG